MDFSGPTGNSSTGGLGVFSRGYTIRMIGVNNQNQQKNIPAKVNDNDYSKNLKVGQKIEFIDNNKLHFGILVAFNKNTLGLVISAQIIDEYEKKRVISITAIKGKIGSSTNADDMASAATPVIYESNFIDFKTFLNELYKDK